MSSPGPLPRRTEVSKDEHHARRIKRKMKDGCVPWIKLVADIREGLDFFWSARGGMPRRSR